MTSVYHRRFYPNDVDATVAYVAPHSLAAGDDRYPAFLEAVGTPTCRADMEAFQREVLLRRPAMEAMLQDLGMQQGVTFDFLGIEMAVEHAAIETSFAFWQYGGEQYCAAIPDASATDQEIFDFLNSVVYLAYFFSDDAVSTFQPYYYQAAVELGYPAPDEAHLSDLLLYPGTDIPDTYCPPGAPLSFDAAAMPAVSSWLGSSGDAMMFIYGETDPWSAGAFDITGAQDTYSFVVPAGNHGALIGDLPDAERMQALDRLGTWSGVMPLLFNGAPPRAVRPTQLGRPRLRL
jgi:hypothetical protein